MEYKAPTKPLRYTRDWTSWLSAGDDIVSSTWTMPPGNVLLEDASSFTANTTSITISGGIAGVTYPVKNSITTAAGEQTDNTFFLTVQDPIT